MLFNHCKDIPCDTLFSHFYICGLFNLRESAFLPFFISSSFKIKLNVGLNYIIQALFKFTGV